MLRFRMEKFKEVDLRQLEDTYYASARRNKKGKGKVSETNAESVVWVDDEEDGLTRYWSMESVFESSALPWSPALVQAMEVLSLRHWSSGGEKRKPRPHRLRLITDVLVTGITSPFCCLCGRSYIRAGDTMLKCVHCPKILHESCLAAYEWPRNSMHGFICPSPPLSELLSRWQLPLVAYCSVV